MKHLDLFSGIGGFALAAEWAGIETIGFVEIDKYCQKVLRKHWPNVPIVEDIRDVQEIKEIVEGAKEFPNSVPKSCNGERISRGMGRITQEEKELWLIPSNLCPDDTHRPRGTGCPAILVTAGFPCQPFSVAGKQLSQGDNRYLWPETIEVIKEIRPEWVLLENVTGIINLALDTVLSDLESAGYTWEALVIPACAVNAPHRRDRIWIVGYSTGDGLSDTEAGRGATPRNQRGKEGQNQLCQLERAGRLRQADVPNTQHSTTTRQRGHSRKVYGITESAGFNISSSENWWAIEPELGRVAYGVPNRVDRLRCLGNAIVPQVAYQILKVMIQIEREAK